MPTMPLMKIGEKLKETRIKRFLSQAELGRDAGIHRDQVGRIERNEVEPHLSTIRKLAKALDVDPTELVR